MPHAAPAARNFATFSAVVVAFLGAQSYIAYQTARPALETARGAYAELLEAERLNARQHTLSLEDRDSTKRRQAENAKRIEALEAAVESLRSELKAIRGDR